MPSGRGNTSKKNTNKKKQQRKCSKKESRQTTQSCNDVDETIIIQPQQLQQPAYWPNYWNFVHKAGIGCHIGFPQHYLLQKNSMKHFPNEFYNTNDRTATGEEATVEMGIYNNEYYDWILDWEDIDVDDDDDESDIENIELPELQIDPNDYTLSLYNYHPDEYQIAFISIYDCKVFGRHSRSLEEPLSSSVTITTVVEAATSNPSTNDDDKSDVPSFMMTQERNCTTLIVLCPPRTVGHLCYLEHTNDDISYYENCIDSDIQIWKSHPNIPDVHHRTIRFPLLTSSTTKDTETLSSAVSSALSPSYLCTQGVGGSLTHFLIGNYHAIDFSCPIGTPIIAVGNGTIEQVHMMSHPNNENTTAVTGIAVSNLFHWNSILLRLDDNDTDNKDVPDNIESVTESTNIEYGTSTNNALFVEYVHIATSIVQVGEHVTEGQIIGTTGSVGFSPEPHLHIAAYRTSDNFAPTCGFDFHSAGSNDSNERTTFLPVAGKWYNENGIVETGICTSDN